jgi:hypothetical protein
MRFLIKPAASGTSFSRAWSILAALLMSGLLSCGGSSTGTSGTAQSADSLATTIDDLIIGAALLDPDNGYVMIDGRKGDAKGKPTGSA